MFWKLVVIISKKKNQAFNFFAISYEKSLQFPMKKKTNKLPLLTIDNKSNRKQSDIDKFSL